MSAVTICLILLIGSIEATGQETIPWPGAGPKAAALADVHFTFTADPSQVVLSVEQYATRTARTSSVSFFADGRALLKRQERDGRILEEYILSLDYQELIAIVRKAVEHGLMECDADKVKSKQRELGNRGHITDASHTTVSIALETYSRGNEVTQQQAENTVRFYAPGFYTIRYPEILEYQAFLHLEQDIRALWELARKEIPQ